MMIYIVSTFIVIVLMYVLVIFCETIALKSPEIKFSKWWRKHIIQFDENQYYD